MSESKDRAEILSDQFRSVFTPEEGGATPLLEGPTYPPIETLTVQTAGVEKLLSQLKPNKSSGPDNIPARLLKELSVELAPALSSFYSQSLTLGTIPVDWSKAYISPIFKKGSRHLAENYRPVSLTSICSKLMEHIIVKHIAKHLEAHSILTQFQHGFRQARSCETQLLTTLHDMMSNWDRKSQLDVTVLDFSKAFDTVPHKRLLSKASHYGINGCIHRWLQSFLSGRLQSVVVEGVRSAEVPVESGVPQGTVLGPMLFLLYVNDLPSNVTSTVRLFADDCLMYRTIHTIEDQTALQKDLDSLVQWCEKWGMRFNASKCEVLRISRKRNPMERMYEIKGDILKVVKTAKYLGVHISNDLEWSSHVSATAKKANGTLAFLRRNLKGAPAKLKETAYFSLVRSVLEYSATVWDPRLCKDINALEMVQRRAARDVKQDYQRTSSVTSMLQQLGWDSLANRRRDLRLTLMYKIINNLSAVPTSDILLPADLRTRAKHKHKFRAIQSTTPVFRNSFFVRTVPEWNGLDAQTVESPTLLTFKTRLKSDPNRY